MGIGITHQEQLERWDKEHKTPRVLLQMDSAKASTGVIKFLDWLKSQGKQPEKLKGLEMCCGKGRNVVELGAEGINMIGLDFSRNAIEEAKRRATNKGVTDKTQFFVQDVTKPFPVEADSLDFAFDCFGSTDIESAKGRKAALENLIRVLKPGGHLMVYLLSSDDEFQKEMIAKSPGPDAGSFIHPINQKYEKVFTEDEVKDFYGQLNLLVLERAPKKDMFFGKEYKANHIWAIFQKPIVPSGL
jgi:ubiquinone/menaquinone biosynthesis C-methylase UbiE